MDDTIIRAEQLNKTFTIKKGKTVEALKSLDLTVKKGVLTAIIGPDGAGKTTFMRLVAGLMNPTKGKLTVLGLDSVSGAEEIQTRISYMPQKFGLYEDLTVMENMNLYADLHGVPEETRPARYNKLLTMMGLERFTGRLAGNLSGGMKQKLGLACTLVRSPELLLLDEPTVGVDPFSRKELWEIVQQFVKEENLSVLVSTAYMNEAALCSHVYVLNKGEILADGTPDDLCQIAAGRCFSFPPPEGVPTRILQAHLIDDTEHIVDAVPRGGEVHYILKENVTSVPYLEKHGIKAKPVASTLEDGFMVLLHKAETESLPIPQEEEDLLDKGGRPGNEVNIIVKNLVRKFGDFTAVANTSFEVHKGEIFGLLGPNGAGKTTTFKMLCGLLPATSGFLSVAGVNLRVARTQARANVGYVAQKFSLYKNMSVMANLEFFGGIYGLPPKQRKERIKAVVDEFYLSDRLDMKAGDLPGGYKQRLAMACALLHQPKILFLDEPTSGIDPLTRRNFWRRITTLAARGTTIIITTHFMEEAEYCDRFMIQDNGHLLAIGSPAEIRHNLHMEGADMDDIFMNIVVQAREKGEENK
ncbi:MAG: ATP-binding cassette domain-containing protein [Acidaminococcus sp.]|jgi:ABC-2 type transport system ATP-binding protein|nr:ATP-binding cassette domain-containing protein [Acidaminococcus sp.]MCI2101061.1 ATP-binding cassette domain-containing protein [Acidaminococcus sp.]MCI2115467.1 ATP-binding cassette domain-containing protein [Acidaminococcus sp.]MCI2117589.1 ATP-binding cassette domain-containing protein [Acidaminococcus sp.]